MLRRGDTVQLNRVTEDEWRTLVTWIDLNAPYHDRFANKRPAQPVYSLPQDRQLEARLIEIHQRRCASCHELKTITRLDWIDLHEPAQSLFLAAPLVRDAGGQGKCGQTIYRDQQDADYRAVRELVAAAVRRAWEKPRRDLIALKETGQREQPQQTRVKEALEGLKR